MSTEIDPIEAQRRELFEQLSADSPYENGQLHSYHSIGAQWDCSHAANYRFGIEAEKEDYDGKDICKQYQGYSDDLLEHQWRAERDGSLGAGGFELISPVYNLKTDKYLEHLSTPVLSYLIHCKTSFRCGGHITISVKDKSHEWYQKKAAQIIPLLYALYPKRAKTSGYARFFHKESHNQRYNAINISGDKMEVRIFAGIKHLKQLKWRVELLRILFCDENHQECTWDSIYKDLLDVQSSLGKHILNLYGKKYGEKIMLATAYSKAYQIQELEWKEYSRVSRLIPNGVKRGLRVQPNPASSTKNPLQLTLDVCDYSQERTDEA